MTEQALVEKLQNSIDFVWNNTCDFYRSAWSDVGISVKPNIGSLSDFEKIPIIDRSTLETRPHPDDRLFVSKNTSPSLSTTSGSVSGQPFVYWRSEFRDIFFEHLAATGSTRTLYIMSYNRTASFVLGTRNEGLSLIPVDPHRLDDAVAMLATGSIDSLSTTPTIACLLADRISDPTFRAHIRTITLWGEQASEKTLQQLQSDYPHAAIYLEFGVSEVGNVCGYSTPTCSESHRHFHAPARHLFHEIVGDRLVVTNLDTPRAMPLIRYHTGDAAVWVEDQCICGNVDRRFTLLGRTGVDFVRTQGLEIHVEQIADILSQFDNYLEPTVHAEVCTHEKNSQTYVHVDIMLMKKNGVAVLDSYLVPQIVRSLIETLPVSQFLLLKDAIAKNICDTPSVHFPETNPRLKNKSITLVDRLVDE